MTDSRIGRLPAALLLVLACATLRGGARPAAGRSVPDAQEAVVRDALQTRAERTGYEETTRYDEVMRIISELQKETGRLRVETFGRSEEGRALPLLVFSDPPITDPRDTRMSAKPIVFVMANIHAGEVEGKEASLQLARRIASGDLAPLLDRLTILIAPIYNADGNERVSFENRPEQNGPIGGVGTRENAKGLDLNRDYMKLESSEGRALVALMTRWDPHVTVDLHTTNGSYHGYHLTYAPALNPNADARLIAYERDELLPVVTRAMQLRHDFRSYYYGNFAPRDALDIMLPSFDAAQPRDGAARPVTGPRVWRTFDHRPRFGNNYVGLRNRIGILSEAYSYLDFAGRVDATSAFVEEILRYCADNGAEIRQLTRRIDLDSMREDEDLEPAQAGVAFELRALPRQMPILVGAVEKRKNPRTGRDMTAMQTTYLPVRMPEYGLFAATQTVALPRAYLIADRAAAAALKPQLLAHGIAVEELAEPLALDADSFVVDRIVRAEREIQGHRETRLEGRPVSGRVSFNPGALLVRTSQPLGRLAFYLLDPRSDDGFTTWNMLDDRLSAGRAHPVLWTSSAIKAAAQLVSSDQE